MTRKRSPKIRFLAWVTLALLILANEGFSQKINWGNASSDSNSSSDGGMLTDATFTFQLGTFSNGDDPQTEFIPDTDNTDFWGSRWVALDTASYNQHDALNEDTGFFSDSWIVPDNTYQGYQAYIWSYNNQAGDATSEWVLITDLTGLDAWKIPDSGGSQQDFPNQWRVSTATDAIFGGLNDVDGPGETDPGAPTEFALQTNTFVPIPESGTLALLGVALGSLVLRRGRVTV